MAKGTRGGRRGAYSVLSLVGTDGATIDLGGERLVYGQKDSALSDGARASIEAFENARYKNKIEFSRFVDANGNVIEDNKGGRGSVRASYKARATAYAMSHNHPRSGGMLGGTFSVGDINNFCNYAQKVYGATAVEGTYRISKARGFDADGLKAYYQQANREARAKYEKAYKDAQAKANAAYHAYYKGERTLKEADAAFAAAKQESAKAFNVFLVTTHNALINGQEKYGYKYSLERR